jgi:hypothetical protein
MKIRLRIELPDNPGFDWSCNEATVEIGRDPGCRLSFPSGGSNVVSGRHARLELSSSGLMLRDMNSANGTFVNGAPVHGAQSLQPNDRVQFGQTGPAAVVIWFDRPQPQPVYLEAPAASSAPMIHVNHAPAAAPAYHQPNPGQMTPLNMLLLGVAILAVIATAVVLAQSNSKSGEFWEEQAKVRQQENESLAKKLEILELNTRKLESERLQLEQENKQLESIKKLAEKWRAASFYITDKKSCAIAIQASRDGTSFRVLDKAGDDQTDLAFAVCSEYQIPPVDGDPVLARQIYETATVGQLLDSGQTSSVSKYWKVQRYVPFGPEQSPEFVRFFDTEQRRNRLGFFLNASSQGLEFYPVGPAAETIVASRIDPPTARKATAQSLKLAPETDFLDLCALRMAQKLGTPNGGSPQIINVAIKAFDPDWLDEFIELSKEPDINWNDYFFDFVARYTGTTYRADSRKEYARVLREAVGALRDEFSRRLADLGVPGLEREREGRVNEEYDRTKSPRSEQPLLPKQPVATHVVIGEVGKPMADGTWRFALRLVTISGQRVFEDDCDIGRPIPPEVSTFFLDSGRVAVVKRASNPASLPLLYYVEEEKYVEKEDKKVRYFLRDIYSQEVRLYPFGADIQLDYTWFPLRIPPRQRMNALMWKLARNIMPRGGRVEQIRGDQAQISLGTEADISVSTRCKAWRVAKHADRQSVGIDDWSIMPFEVSVSEVTGIKAKVRAVPTGLEGLWPDSGLAVGDIVVRKDAKTPFVAICPFQYTEEGIDRELSLKLNALKKNHLGNYQQLVVDIENASNPLCLAMETFLRSQNVAVSDPVQVARLGGGDYRSPPHMLVARELGITHVIYGALSPDSINTQKLKVKVYLRIFDVQSNKIVLTLSDLPLTVEDIQLFPAIFREPPSPNWIFPVVDRLPGYSPIR